LENYKYDDISELLKAQKILMNEILNNAGNFRTSNVRVGEHIAPQVYLVSELMEQLFEWLKIRNHQEAYYKALEDSTAIGESTPFIEFMLDMILQTITKFSNEVGNKVGNLTENQIMIVQLMKVNSKISAKKLSEEVGISVRKIEENMSKLKKQDIINRVGGTRGYWEVKE
jgi:Fic family protein